MQAANAHTSEKLVTACTSMDIWQLGVLFFEVLTERPYWPEDFGPDDVMLALTGGAPLPHEDPQMLDQMGRHPSLLRVKALLGRMLDRDHKARPTAEDVKRSIESEFDHNTIGGATMTYQAMNTVII